MKCQAGIVLNISDVHDGKGRVQKMTYQLAFTRWSEYYFPVNVFNIFSVSAKHFLKREGGVEAAQRGG